MATLYNINQELLNCITVEDGTTINTETGEVIDVAALEALELALWIKNLKSDVNALDAEEKAFKARKDAAKKESRTVKRLPRKRLERRKSDRHGLCN